MKTTISHITRSMSWAAIFSMVMLMCFAFAESSKAQVLINTNGGFEASDVTVGQDTSTVDGWEFNAPGFAIVNDTVREGSRALEITVDSLAGPDPWSIEALNAPFPIEPGVTYEYEAWVRASSSGATVHFTGGNPSFAEFLRLERNENIGTSWELIETTFTVPEGDTTGRFPLHFNFEENVGKKIYIDGLKVRRPFNNSNGSFEASLVTVGEDTADIRGWDFNMGGDADANWRVVSDPVKDGNRALAVTVNAIGTDPWHVELLSTDIPVIPGKEYEYSVWVRSDSEGATGHFTVGNPSFSEHMRTEVNEEIGTEWQEVTAQFTVPEGDTAIARGPIHFGFEANVGKTLYVDSLRIKEYVEPTVTGEPVIVEAESGTVGSEFETIGSGDSAYISITTDYNESTGSADYPGENRTASYQVTFPDTGSYDLFAKMRVGPETFDDDSWFYGFGFGEKNPDSASHWVMSNGMASAGFADPEAVVRDAGGLGEEVWKWVNLSRNAFQGDTSLTFVIDTPGDLTRTFEIGAREDGLDIDKLAFGNSSLFYTVENLNNGEPGVQLDPRKIPTSDPIAQGKEKFLGNVHSSSQAEYFTNFWNQVTPENSGKWGSVESTRDVMNWDNLDAAYNLAKENGYPFRYHVLIWGQQQPAWMNRLSETEQKEEIQEWFTAVAERYPDIEYLEVVNEALPGHNQPAYKEALGGDGDTGFDWVIEAFRMAKETFPDSTKLMINDYGIVSSSSAANNYIDLINLLKDRDLIDGIGVQAHAFSTGGSNASMRNILDQLGSTGLFIQATELDIDGDPDASEEESAQTQLERYKRIFPVFWKHPDVEGVTLWGWKPGMWRTDQDAYLFTSNLERRPALEWLRSYVDTASTDVAIEGPVSSVPREYKLHENYPNPFNPTTKIGYEVPEKANVSIQVYDITGRLVQTLVNETKNPGRYTINFEANQLSSGVYLYRIQAGSFSKVKRMMLIK